MIKLFVTCNGYLLWECDDRQYNRNGPAVTWIDGSKFWRIDTDVNHRLDGPAVEMSNGSKWWCINGIEYTEFDYWLLIQNYYDKS